MEPERFNTIICLGCGWIGDIAGLGEFGSCPTCNYENAYDKPFRLLTIAEILKDKSGATWYDVDIAAYTNSLLKHLGVVE